MKLDYRGRIDRRTGREHIGVRVICGAKDGQEVVLRPGVNDLTAEEWGWIKDAKAVASMRSQGVLVPLHGDKNASFDLSKVASFEALSLVQRTTEPGVLREWKEQVETSPKLGSADEGDIWRDILSKIEKALQEATTDQEGRPAMPRKIRIGQELY